ncbi:MAG: ABC transporter ATP-binding protein, partial [Brevibacterium sp.]|nr:ABC transporter ATP-binding protein [Brevibacterium sp.]
LTDALALDPDQTWTVDSLLEAVDLPLDAAQRFSHSFSGGQRQRIAIARALAAGPKVLVGDEPIASLDAFLQARIAKMMRDLAIESGASMIFISHDLSIVHEIADRVAVMEAGGVVEVGSTEQIWNDPQHPYTKKLLSAIPRVDGKGIIPG